MYTYQFIIGICWCYYINGHCFKFATSQKKFRQACPPSLLMHFSIGSIHKSLVKKNSKLTKLFNFCWNHVLFILCRSCHFQQMLNNFVSFEFFFTKLSWIDPCEKHNNILGGHAWQKLFRACSKLEAMAIYVVKSANANDKLPMLNCRECKFEILMHYR